LFQIYDYWQGCWYKCCNLVSWIAAIAILYFLSSLIVIRKPDGLSPSGNFFFFFFRYKCFFRGRGISSSHNLMTSEGKTFLLKIVAQNCVRDKIKKEPKMLLNFKKTHTDIMVKQGFVDISFELQFVSHLDALRITLDLFLKKCTSLMKVLINNEIVQNNHKNF
jgi:hypothetical protein